MPGEPPDQPVPTPDTSQPDIWQPGSEATASVAVKGRSPGGPVLAAVIAGAVGVGGLVMLTRGESRDDDPVEVVREYFDAFSNGDCERTVDLIDTGGPDRAEWLDACRQAYEERGDGIRDAELATAELVAEEGDHATVRTQIAEPGEDEPSEPEDVRLVRVGGDWRIDLGDTVPDPPDGERRTADTTTGDAVGGDAAP